MKNYKTINTCDKTLAKDEEIATNTCASQTSQVKNVLGKFFRKQDVAKIQKKKKEPSVHQTSLICYLGAKGCESNRLIKQKIKQCRSEVDMVQNVIEQNNAQSNIIKGLKRYQTKPFLVNDFRSAETSLQKHNNLEKKNNKIIITSLKNQKQKNSAQEQYLIKQNSQKKSPAKRLNKQPTSNPQTKQSQKIQILKQKHQKQLLKLKNQCQHYNQLLQKNTINTTSLTQKLKQVQKQSKQLKSKHAKTLEQKQKQSKQIKQKQKFLQNQNNQLKLQNRQNKQQIAKQSQEIHYLKDIIRDLNQRINEILQQNTGFFNANIGGQLTSSLSLAPKNKRFNSFCTTSQKDNMQRLLTSIQVEDVPNFSDEEKKIIQQLRNQLKYCHVQISMLKKVKLDVNKQNQEFNKLQKQNKILKDQIFEMKTSPMIDQLNKSNNKSSNKNTKIAPIGMRNNFQINLERGTRANRQNQKRSDSCSSDTLSLNLSLSPQKQRNRK